MNYQQPHLKMVNVQAGRGRYLQSNAGIWNGNMVSPKLAVLGILGFAQL